MFVNISYCLYATGIIWGYLPGHNMQTVPTTHVASLINVETMQIILFFSLHISLFRRISYLNIDFWTPSFSFETLKFSLHDSWRYRCVCACVLMDKFNAWTMHNKEKFVREFGATLMQFSEFNREHCQIDLDHMKRRSYCLKLKVSTKLTKNSLQMKIYLGNSLYSGSRSKKKVKKRFFPDLLFSFCAQQFFFIPSPSH